MLVRGKLTRNDVIHLKSFWLSDLSDKLCGDFSTINTLTSEKNSTEMLTNMTVAMLLLSGVTSSSNRTEETDRSTIVIGTLKLGELGKWSACESSDCTMRWLHVCAKNDTHPQLSCGQNIWKEELVGCSMCSNDIWMSDSSDWSSCSGSGCDDTIQTYKKICGDKAYNSNCRKIQTRYCKPSKVCDGTWSNWSWVGTLCKDKCEKKRAVTRTRTCIKNGTASSNCDSTIYPFIKTKIDYCKAKACPTTTTQTTTTEESTVTTQAIAKVNEWSDWSICNASCQKPEGIQERTRECIYKNSIRTPASGKCQDFNLVEIKKCKFKNFAECTTSPSETTLNSITTTASTVVAESTTGNEDIKARIQKIRQTPSKRSHIINTNAPDSGTREAGLTKQQYHILVIILGTTAAIAVLIGCIYFCCSRNNRKKQKKKRLRKFGEISIVGLESHTGFMVGMEKYGFKKTMMPSDTLISGLPQSPIGESESSHMVSAQENQNSQHIYEEMHFPSTEVHEPRIRSSPMKRSMSHKDRHQDYNFTPRRSIIIDTQYATPLKKKAPPKPPRRSMPQIDDIAVIERQSWPNQPTQPALDFLNNIRPPTGSPPVTPHDDIGIHLSAPVPSNRKSLPSKSAPTTPNHYKMGAVYTAQLPYINYVPTPLFLPVGSMQVMTQMQNNNGEVIYMPSIMPIQQIHTDNNSPDAESTPLHGTSITRVRNPSRPIPKPRPHSVAVLPQISVSEVNDITSRKLVINPSSEEYAEMEQWRLSHQEAQNNALRRKSFKNLHGMHDEQSPNKEDTNKDIIAEDAEGYVISTS